MRELKISQSITNRDSASVEKYLAEVSKEGMISADEEAELAIKIREGDQMAHQKLVKANLRFVISVAKQYQGRGISLADLISSGNMGLIEAAQRFDESRGFKFISYAVWWIRQSIIYSISQDSRTIRLPFNKIADLTKINKAHSELSQQKEREPTVEELAENLEFDLDRVAHTLEAGTFSRSINAPMGNPDNPTLEDILEDTTSVSIDDTHEKESIAAIIKFNMLKLSERERYIIIHSFGIGPGGEASITEIAAHYDITPERVRQIKIHALTKLRRNLKL